MEQIRINNFNKSLALASVFIVMVLLLLAFSSYTHAALPTTPVPSYDTVEINQNKVSVSVSKNQLADWAGSFNIQPSNILFQGSSLNNLIRGVLGLDVEAVKKEVGFNPKSVYEWTGELSKTINTQTQNPAMTIVDGRVTKFTPPQLGRSIDRYNSTLQIIEGLEDGRTSVEVTVSTTQPEKPLSELNQLGITELIGRGESKFAGSPSNRLHNIRVGIEKMSGIIVNPGEEFSFNKYLGPVEAYAGFLPELVIKGNQTIPELGGGLCQVSSTLFRGIMNAGLPVTQRRNHSYAVQYYAPNGTDATIYPGVIDLKFTNDTAHSILIWPYFKSPTHIVFDFYGTSDGREVILPQPYTYDKKPDGSLKATWKRTVIKNGEKKEDVFNSTYRPPNQFKRQESFVATDGTTTQSPTTPPTAPTPEPVPTPPTETPTPVEQEEVVI